MLYVKLICGYLIGISLDIYLNHYIFNDKNYFLQMIFKFISEILLSLGFVIDKYTMEKNFVHLMKYVFIMVLLI